MFVEILGSAAGVAYVWLMARQNIWCWPVGVIYIGASYVVFFNARLYAELASHSVYLILTLYGWYTWVKKGNQTETFKVSRLAASDIVLIAALNIVFSILFGTILARHTDNALPYIDSAVAIMSFTGMWLSAQKKIENWHLWAIVNTISIAMYWRQSLYLYVLLYILFLMMAFMGYRSWKYAKSL